MPEDTFTLKCRVLLEAAQAEVDKVGKQVENTMSRAAKAAGQVWAGITTGRPEKAAKGAGDLGGMLMGGISKMVLPLLAIESLMRNSGMLLKSMQGIMMLIGLILRPIGDVIGGVVLTLFRILLPFIRMLTVAWQPYQRSMLDALKAAQAPGTTGAGALAIVTSAALVAVSSFLRDLMTGSMKMLGDVVVSGIGLLGGFFATFFDRATGGIFNLSGRWAEAVLEMRKLVDAATTRISSVLAPAMTNSFDKAKTGSVDPLTEAMDRLSGSAINAASEDGLAKVGGQLSFIGANGGAAASALSTLGNAITDFMRRLGSVPTAPGGGGAAAAPSYYTSGLSSIGWAKQYYGGTAQVNDFSRIAQPTK